MGRWVRLWSSIWPRTIWSQTSRERWVHGGTQGSCKHRRRKGKTVKGTNGPSLTEASLLLWVSGMHPLPCHHSGSIFLRSSEPRLHPALPPDLDTAAQDVGEEFPVEMGVLLTLEHHIPQLLSQLQFPQVLFQGLGDGIPGSQLVQYHCIVPACRGQAVQEKD